MASERHLAQLTAARANHPRGDAWRLKISATRKGKPLSDAHRKALKVAWARGRGVRNEGALNVSAKLTEEDVRGIRAATGTISAISRRFNISRSAVRKIRLGEAWRNVT